MHSIFQKALWDQRRSLPAWASSLAFIIFLEAALWPSMRDMSGLDAYLEEFPAGLRELFGIDQMTTGTGFFNAELFTLLLPMMFLVYAISRGARMVAGEEEQGTLDLLLVTPVSTTKLLLEEAAALALGVMALGLVVILATVAGSTSFGLGIDVTSATVGATALVLLGIEFGLVALVTGAMTGRRGLAIGVPGALVMAAYVWFVAGAFVDDLSSWRALSPFDQALHEGPLSAHAPASFVWLMLPSTALLLAALPLWSRRDIGAGR